MIISLIIQECHFRIFEVKLIFCFFTCYRFLYIYLNVNKSPTNIMNITHNGADGYLNTMQGVIMGTLSFEYHIQGIS